MGDRVDPVQHEVRFKVDPDQRTLVLHHPLIDAGWNWNEQGRLGFARFLHRSSSKAWVSDSPQEGLFLLGVRGHGNRFHPFDAHREVFAGTIGNVRLNQAGTRGCVRASLDIDLHHPPVEVVPPPGGERVHLPSRPAPILATWHVEAHPEHAAIRQWFEITNTGDEEVVITRLPVMMVELAGSSNGLTAHSGLNRKHRFRKEEGADWFTWQELNLKPGVVGTIDSGHRRGSTWLGITSADGPGLYVGWESNACATCDYGDLNGSGNCGIDIWLEPEYRLAPGQVLISPPAFLGASDGDLDELSYRSQRFVEQVIARQVTDERFPYVAFNSWGYGDRIDDASMRRCFERCQQLGIELFVVDFGWEDADWHPRADLFPNGLAPLADAAHQAGMAFGVHLSFGNVSSLSQMFREHPEWANGPGQWAYLTEGEVFRVVLGNPDARDWMIDKLVSIVDETKIDYFLTDHFMWGPVNPEVQEMRATDDYLTLAEGFDLIIEGLLARRPNVMVEHCDNGLGLPTFKMVAQHVTSIGPDAVGSQYERVSTWRLSRVFPPRYLDHYVCERHAPHISFDEPFGDYEYRSQIFGGPMILMTDIMALTEGDSDWTALSRTIDLYKRIRRRVAEGKVLHLLEPQPYERVGNGWDGWDAIGSWHEATDTAVVLAFRLGGDLDERVIPLHGLTPEIHYRVSFDDRADEFVQTGAELMEHGILLSLPGPGQPRKIDQLGFVRASEVIHFEPVSQEI
jgi:hypothetical protein